MKTTPTSFRPPLRLPPFGRPLRGQASRRAEAGAPPPGPLASAVAPRPKQGQTTAPGFSLIQGSFLSSQRGALYPQETRQSLATMNQEIKIIYLVSG